jgi:hypothetical protein
VPCLLNMTHFGYWIVRQENGEIRTYSPEKFNLIYDEV